MCLVWTVCGCNTKAIPCPAGKAWQKGSRRERIRLQPRRLNGHEGEEQARHFAHHQDVCDGEEHEADALVKSAPWPIRVRPEVREV